MREVDYKSTMTRSATLSNEEHTLTSQALERAHLRRAGDFFLPLGPEDMGFEEVVGHVDRPAHHVLLAVLPKYATAAAAAAAGGEGWEA